MKGFDSQNKIDTLFTLVFLKGNNYENINIKLENEKSSNFW